MVKDGSKLFTNGNDNSGQGRSLAYQAGLLGVFIGVLNIVAHSIFLARYDISMLAKAYAVSGLAGVLLVSLYSIFKARSGVSIFSFINSCFIFLATVATWIIYRISPGDGIIFVIFILLGPLSILALMGLYNIVAVLPGGQRQEAYRKQIEYIIIAGGLAGSFAVPLLDFAGIDLGNIYFIAPASILGVSILQLLFAIRSRSQYSSFKEEKEKEDAHLTDFIFKKSYAGLMAIFILLSVVVLFFIQYSFLAATRNNYPGENDIARFLGMFEGSVLVALIILRKYFSSFILRYHGPRIAILIGPVLVTLLTFGAAITGSRYGYVTGTSGFIIFFILLSTGRFFSKALKESVDTSALMIMKQTISKEARESGYFSFFGSFNEIAVIISGVLLTLAGSLFFASLINITWLIPFISIIWMLTGSRLYSEYRKSVSGSMHQEEKTDESDVEMIVNESTSEIGFQVRHNYFNLLEDMVSGKLEAGIDLCKILIRQAKISPDPSMLPLMRKLCEHQDNSISEEAYHVIRLYEVELTNKVKAISPDISKDLEVAEDKIGYLNNLVASGRVLALTDLIFLIRNSDLEIRRIAINQSGKFRVAEMLPELCECLAIPSLANDACSVIKSFGVKAFKPLASTFYRTSGNTEVSILIIRLFGESGASEANEFLLPRLFSVHKLIRREALDGLLKCGYRPDEETKKKLMNSVKETIAMLTWNLSASFSIRGKDDNIMEEAIRGESGWWLNFLLDMLALMYDKSQVARARSEIEKGTRESLGLAHEMFDIILDDEIKTTVRALIDTAHERNRLQLLFRYNPGSVPAYDEAIEDLINKDYNHISVWTKSCAVRSLHKLEDPGDPGFIIALLFSPHKILREEAAKYLRERYREAWSKAAYRLPESFRDHLTRVFEEKIGNEEEVYNKVMVLSGFLGGIHRDHLVNLADNLKIPVNGEVESNNDFLLFCLPENNEGAPALYARWRVCGLDNIPDKGSDLLKKYRVYYLNMDHLTDAIFFDQGLKERVISMIDGITV